MMRLIKRFALRRKTMHEMLELKANRTPKCIGPLMILLFLSPLVGQSLVAAQGGRTLFGDVRIDKDKSDDKAPLSVTLILYRDTAGEVGRQIVSNGSRYRFTNLPAGEYEIAVEVENTEIARLTISMMTGSLSNSPYGFQQDLEFKWRPKVGAAKSKIGVISAADTYTRSSVNQSLFQKAQDAVEKKKLDESVRLLKQIIESDKLDFQAWTILGTVYRVQEKPADAEKAYLSAIEVRPTFTLALLNLGRLRSSLRKFEEAIDPLTRAVDLLPESAETNLLLGEAYLQIKKGSKAIPYLNEAARLGRPEAHLRLGWLYNAAGLKDKAALEYEQFLSKQPDYPERRKLEEYITANKKG